MTYHLQLVLPEFLLPRLIKERELSHMVNEDVSQNGELGVQRRYLAKLGFEGGTKPTQGSG